MNGKRWILWCAYAAFVVSVGLLLSVAELQHYLAAGLQRPWEPFVWELGSVSCIGLLAIAVYRWHGWLCQQQQRWVLVVGHALGLPVYIAAHVAGLLATRAVAYAWMGLPYDPGPLLAVLGYESAKDAISYALILGISQGLRLYLAEQQRRQEIDTLRAELDEARLSRLAEQIQPHFLFNTLNLISQVMYEDVARADHILCELATLLRQALAAQQSGTHTVAQELALVQPYLSIMQSRFGDRLQISVTATPEALACVLPALLLISPVENAIKHGVAVSRETVRVSVDARVDEGQLLLTVAHSGAPPLRDDREGAIGLANTRERLRACYGALAQVSLAAGAGGGSLLSLVLPAQAAACD